MNSAFFGQLSKGSVQPFIARQYYHQPPWTLSDTLGRAIEFYHAIFEDPPRRKLAVVPPKRKPLLVASDAQVERGQPPGAGYIIFDPEDGALRGALYKHLEKELNILGTSQGDIEVGSQLIAR